MTWNAGHLDNISFMCATLKIMLDPLVCFLVFSKIPQIVGDFLKTDPPHSGTQAIAPSTNSAGCAQLAR